MEKPGRPLSTMNSEISFSPVRADTRKKSDQKPSLMKCLLPLSTQPFPLGSARVLMPCASDPAPGSVMAMAQVRSPRTEGSSQRSTCSPRQASRASYTLPKARRIRMSVVWPNSSSHSMASRADRPAPPSSSGMFSAYRPSAFDFAWIARAVSSGSTPVLSIASSSGCSSCAMKRRTVSSSMRWSSSRPKFMRRSPDRSRRCVR